MNSLEKLARFQAELAATEPADEQTAQLMQMATLAGPMIGPMLPADPAVLDEQLLALAGWLLKQRSDDAAAATLATLDPDTGGWRTSEPAPMQEPLGDQ